MNTKRQTIWLVSMLSLMVVLSAYYLFTEDVDKLKGTAADPAASEQVNLTHQDATDATAKNTAKDSDNKGTALDSLTDPTAANPAAVSTTGSEKKAEKAADKSGEPADVPATAQEHTEADANKLTDEQILDKVANQANSEQDFFTYTQIQQNDQLAKQLASLQTLMTDSTQSFEAQAKANEDYDMLEKQQAKKTSIEEQLLKDGYANALVQQESGKWKIIVQSSKLEKSQAVSIIDLASQVLNVSPDKVVIQYHK